MEPGAQQAASQLSGRQQAIREHPVRRTGDATEPHQIQELSLPQQGSQSRSVQGYFKVSFYNGLNSDGMEDMYVGGRGPLDNMRSLEQYLPDPGGHRGQGVYNLHIQDFLQTEF